MGAVVARLSCWCPPSIHKSRIRRAFTRAEITQAPSADMHTNVVSQRPQAWLSELEVDKLIGVLGLAKRSSTTEIPTLTTATVLSEGTFNY